MEVTCHRCHQAVLADSSYCPACGLPQFVYSAEAADGPVQPEQWNEDAGDASAVNWKQALRVILLVALPAGLLSSAVSPIGMFGLIWMTTAASMAVFLYVRSQRPAWLTIGAGMRIGLVTGLMAGWLAFGINGGALCVERFALHQASQIDVEWKSRVEQSQQLTQQWTAGMEPADATQAQAVRAQVQLFMLSPWGHAGIEAFGYACNAVFLIFFAVGGGALGARFLARSRQPEV